eukprot:148650_1
MSYYSSNNNSNRQQRLNNGSNKVLYHQTNKESAYSILSSRKFKCGPGGLAASGIYFATTRDHTHHKSRNQGVIIECRVKLGNIKTVNKNGNQNVSYSSLTQSGYDSVCIPRDNGYEYVVYNTDQITIISNGSSTNQQLGMITNSGTYRCAACNGLFNEGIRLGQKR